LNRFYDCNDGFHDIFHHGKSKKGKSKKGCKGKSHKAKMSLQDMDSGARGGLLVGISAMMFLMGGWALVAYRHARNKHDGYEVMDIHEPPTPTVPTAFSAFGTYSAEEIKNQAKLMRIPPSNEGSNPDPVSIIN